MSYGMTYDQFWNGDVHAHRAYREAHRYTLMEKNRVAWLQGQYVYAAIGAWSPIIRAFSKARRPGEYPDKPFEIDERERREREEQEARAKYLRIKEKVAAFADEFNKKRKEVDNA